MNASPRSRGDNSDASSDGISGLRDQGPEGKAIATFKEDARGITLNIAKKQVGDFGAYLAKALPQLYEAYTRETQAPTTGEAAPQN